MRHVLRQLAKAPGFTVVALATLALGIGVTTTAFTVLNRLLLQALPFHDSGRLVQIWATTPQNSAAAQAPGDYFDLREQNTVFASVAAYIPGSRGSLAEPGQPPAQYVDTPVTASFFPLFGIQTQLGRTFTADEEGHSENVAVISNSFWREHYHADPNILGRTAKVNSKLYTIVGVLGPALDEPTLFGGRPAFWLLDQTRANRNLRGMGWYTVAARLKPGVTIEQAQAEMTALAQRMARDNPKTNEGRGLKVVPYPVSILEGSDVQLTWLVLALAGLVLLIACANLANLQLVRTLRRTQELGVRIALGCPRSSLIRMLLTESLVVSVAGGALGLLVAKWSNAFVASFFSLEMPLDLRVVGFTFLVSLLTGAVFGTVPAWIAARTDVNASLKAGGRGGTADRSRHWLRQGLVVVELGLALTLLAGAGFFVRGIYKLTHQELGWSADHVLVGYIELDHDHYGEQGDERSLQFGEKMIAALEAQPGVDAAELSMDSPAWGLRTSPFRVEGQPPPVSGHETYAGSTAVTPEFFKIYGIHLLQGRNFQSTDRPGAPPVVIVNATMAAQLWPGENPIGKRIGGVDPAKPDWAEVVGVMSDFKGAADFYDASQTGLKFVRPWAQNTHRFITFNVRTTGEPEAFKETVRKTIGQLAPDFALSEFDTVKATMAGEVAYFTFLRRVLLQISGLGLLLAVVGVYGVVANLASERTKEIGIRMALGATPRDIVWLFLRNGVQLATLGAAIGLVASYFLLKLLGRMLTVIPGASPGVLAGVALGLVAVAVVASWLPARRTTQISPTEALRAE